MNTEIVEKELKESADWWIEKTDKMSDIEVKSFTKKYKDLTLVQIWRIEINMNTHIIQENLKKYMEDETSKLVSCGEYKVSDFKNLSKVLNNTEEDFLIFDNAGGRKFDIMFDRILSEEEKLFKVKDFIEHLLSNNKSWIYCYQIDNKQVILKEIK